MARRTTSELLEENIAALIVALASVGAEGSVISSGSENGAQAVGAVVEIEAQLFEVEIASVVTAERGREMGNRRKHKLPPIVIATRIASDAKKVMREMGTNFFDRRGELRIVSPPLFLDTVVEPQASIVGSRRGALSSQVAKEVAIACLLTPTQQHEIRKTARLIGRAPSAVSNAMALLREDGLLTSVGEAIVPDLFQELLSEWRKQSFPLGILPNTSSKDSKRLQLGLANPESSTGWALTDTRAAIAWGMPIIASSDYPPDFYLPTKTALLSALSQFGRALDHDSRACTVAVAPVRLVCRNRIDHYQASGEQWPIANHIVVALDIATDRARGLEALDQWNPEGITRAW